MSEPEKSEIINNALDAGPTIPFPNFSKLFLSLEQANQEIISASVQNVIKGLDDDSKRKLLLVIPESAKRFIGF